jgi:small-conductance mechanosensitive channel
MYRVQVSFARRVHPARANDCSPLAEGADMIVVSLLVVIVALLYAHQSDGDYSLGIALLIGAFTWLAIEIHLLRILADFFAVALEHWLEIVMALGVAIVLIVPAIMIYIAVQDELDHRGRRPCGQGIKQHRENRGEL